MNERIQQIIESLGIKKAEFAKRLNVSAPFASELCSGAKKPSDRTIADICRKFNVSETWLRTGEGEMFVPRTRSEELADFLRDVLHSEPDSFRRRVISILAKLTPSDWEAIERRSKEILAELDEEEKEKPTP